MSTAALVLCFVGQLLITAQPSSSQRICKHAGLSYDSTAAGAPLTCNRQSNPPQVPLFADFNCDGRTDMFCNKFDFVADELYLSTPSGIYYTKQHTKTEKWCLSTEGVMMTGDVNGDGKTDLICRFNDGNKFQVKHFGTSKFAGTQGMRVSFICPMQSTLLIGDVSGDGVDDFICIDKSLGNIRIHYNGGHRRRRRHDFGNLVANSPSFYGYHPAIPAFCGGPTRMLRLGDFDGDRKMDLLCFDKDGGASSLGRVEIAFSKNHAQFQKVVAIDLLTSLCSNQDGFYVADVNGDGAADIICLDDTGNTESIRYYEHREEKFTEPSITVANTCGADDLAFAHVNNDRMADAVCIGQSTSALTITYATCEL